MALKMLFFFAVASLPAWMLLYVGLGTRRDMGRKLDREYTPATGTIVDYVRVERPAGGRGPKRVNVYYKPVVEYTAEGQSYRETYENSLQPEQFPVGSVVDVRYDVSTPTHFHLTADPVMIYRGDGAIRVSIIWILAAAVLTVALAVFVGGARFDFGSIWHQAQSVFHPGR